MKRCLCIWLFLTVLTLSSYASEWQSIDLKDGTTLYGRVVEVTTDSVHLVSTQINRKIPLDQLSPEARKHLEAPALASSGKLDETREKLVTTPGWTGDGRSTTIARPRLTVHPLFFHSYGARAHYPYYPHFRRHSHYHHPTLSVRINF